MAVAVREAGRRLAVLWEPNPGAQTAFLASTAREVLYGGAVGGGKSDALIAAPLRWVGHPRHRAIIMRRERPDLQELIDRMRELYPLVVPGATWVESRSRFEFPTGAIIQAGAAERLDDIYAYKSFEYNWVGFDELTLWLAAQYEYMFSRNRSKNAALPLQVRAGTNPDGDGHEWVWRRFIEKREPWAIYRYTRKTTNPNTGATTTTSTTRQFIPATLYDNPRLPDRDAYIAGLQAMGPHIADALIYGRWDFFRGQMFPYGPTAGIRVVERGLKARDHYVVRCLDYGWTDPTVIYWLVVYPGTRDAIGPLVEIAAELRVTETSIPAIAHLVADRERDLAREGLEVSPCRLSVADPNLRRAEATSAGRSVYDLMQEHGLWFDRATNDRQAGWAQTRLMLEHDRVSAWEGACPYLLATLPKLVRDPAKAEDIKAKQDDHGADAFRYGLMAIREAPIDPARPEVGPTPGVDPIYEALTRELRRQSASDSFGATPLDGLDGF